MGTKVKDGEGQVRFELQLGKSLSPKDFEWAMKYPCFVEARGLELTECCAILGRKVRGPTHVFGSEASEEIILNWG